MKIFCLRYYDIISMSFLSNIRFWAVLTGFDDRSAVNFELWKQRNKIKRVTISTLITLLKGHCHAVVVSI